MSVGGRDMELEAFKAEIRGTLADISSRLDTAREDLDRRRQRFLRVVLAAVLLGAGGALTFVIIAVARAMGLTE